VLWPDTEVEKVREAVIDWLANAGHLHTPWSPKIVGEELRKAIGEWRWWEPTDEEEREAIAYWALERAGLEPAAAFLALARARAENIYYDPFLVVSEIRRNAA
jgi:hypothetical protein